MKELLIESYKATKKITGIDPSKPGKLRGILVDDKAFNVYTESLSDGLKATDRKAFKLLAENTRRTLLENSMYQLNPYETLALPLLRVFYPRVVSKELVTVIPMDKPEIVRGFIRPVFSTAASTNEYAGPSMTDISTGPTPPSMSVPASVELDITQNNTHDLFQVFGPGGNINPSTGHIEKTVRFVKATVVVNNATWASADIDYTTTVDGTLAFKLTFTRTENNSTSVFSAMVNGSIDYMKGVLTVHHTALQRESGSIDIPLDYTIHLFVSFTVSLEENQINPRVKFMIDKMRLVAKDRQISTEWSIQYEQDIKALFSISTQAELVSIIGQQIVLDIDREIINSLIYIARTWNGTSHVAQFSKTPPATFTWGPKMWFENVLVPLNTLSAQIYNDTNMGPGNVMACNPLDASIFESLQEFRYTGSSSENGDLGYESATVANGKWKVLVSSAVPRGKVVLVYLPNEEIKSVFIFAPYVPAILTPYPLGAKPSLTVISRYGTQLVRPQGVALLEITD